MQPGYDALGFISCTGTNFLMHAQAFCSTVLTCIAVLDDDSQLPASLRKRTHYAKSVVWSRLSCCRGG